MIRVQLHISAKVLKGKISQYARKLLDVFLSKTLFKMVSIQKQVIWNLNNHKKFSYIYTITI